MRGFVDFMLDMILRTLKAKGETQGGKKKVVRKGGKKKPRGKPRGSDPIGGVESGGADSCCGV